MHKMNKKNIQAVGILGGTFDPIHEGHIAIAEHVLQAFALHHVELIPCFQPPHRHQPIASPEHRLAMTHLAVQNHPRLLVNDIEIMRQGISYSVDTLMQLREKFKETAFYLILGEDAFVHFNEWHEWEKIFEFAHLIIVSRSQSDLTKPAWLKPILNQRQITDKKDFHKNSAGSIYFEKIEPIAISATQIREAILAEKKGIPGLAKNVRDYISKHHIYQ